MGKVSQTKGLVEQMETLIAKSKLIDKQYADFLSNGLNFYKQQLSLNSIASSTTPSAQNLYDTLLQKASQAVASNHLEEAKVYFQQALTEFEPTLDNVNILMYYSLISGYTSVLLANYDGQEAISLIEASSYISTSSIPTQTDTSSSYLVHHITISRKICLPRNTWKRQSVSMS